MLHSNLLGRLGNGLLKFVVLVVMACNISGAFAETIEGDVTVNPGETLTITSEVTITGNLINNGGIINVGANGVLTVKGNVTNTSAYSTTEFSTSTSTSTSYSPSEEPSWPTGWTYPKTRTRAKNVTTTIENTPILKLGVIEVSNGGTISVKGDFTNNSTMTIQSTDASNISSVSVKGIFVNSERNTVIGNRIITSTTETTNQSQTRTGNKNKDIGSWSDVSSSESSPSISEVAVSSTTSAVITLTNGYLLVDGKLELQDNSTITFAGSGIGDDIESTIRVRNISGTEGNVNQSENAVITLASGAKGSMVVEATFTDNTTSDSKHPWTISDEGELTVNSGFSLYVSTYQSDKLNALIDESLSDKTIDELQERLDLIDDVDIEEYLQVTYPEEYEAYLASGSNKKFSKYLSDNNVSLGGALLEFFTFGFFSNYGQFKKDVQKAMEEEIKNLETTISVRELIEIGIQAALIAEQSKGISTLLPIELTSFTASATNNGFVFNWVTASEVNNDYFTLEYSIDGVDFNKIDYVHGAGTTSETSEYEYRWDEAPEFDVVYFRLKQTDYNGEYSYSDVIAASRKKSSGANGTFRYGPLNLQIQDGELRYIVK